MGSVDSQHDTPSSEDMMQMWNQLITNKASLLEQIDHCGERLVDQAYTCTFADKHPRNKSKFSLKNGQIMELQHGLKIKKEK